MPTIILNENLTKPNTLPQPVSVRRFINGSKIVEEAQSHVLVSSSPANPTSTDFGNSFIGACWMAYSKHHPLVLRPDDIWAAITLSFANYVGDHAEEMRSSFVDHTDKDKIHLVLNAETLDQVCWKDTIFQFTAAVQSRIKQDILEWISPNFSTTTEKDIIVCQVALMGAMKHYFEYQASCCDCGLPSITLEGTLEDWRSIRQKIDRLLTFNHKDLAMWHLALRFILDKFIDTYQGNNVDKKFWSQIVDYRSGSGSSDVTGWALAFCPFYKGRLLISAFEKENTVKIRGFAPLDILQGLLSVSVPVKINEGSVEHEMTFIAGAFVSNYTANKGLGPSFDWAILKKGDPLLDEVPLGIVVYRPDLHKHHLVNTKLSSWNHRCDVCGGAMQLESFRCQDCDFDAHEYCVNFEGMILQKPELHSHSLNYVMFNTRGDDKADTTMCSACQKVIRYAGYSCEQNKGCNFHLHLQCPDN